MDTEKQINSLSGETLALQAILANLCAELSKISPAHAAAVDAAFEVAEDEVAHIAIKLGTTASPDHTLRALKIVGGLRAVASGD